MTRSDQKCLYFLTRVLTAAGDKGLISPAPWSVWLAKPDEAAMRTYGSKLTPILTGLNEGLPLALADVAYRTVKLLLQPPSKRGSTLLVDAPAIVGMLLRFLYDQLPGAAALVEEACLKAICGPATTVEKVKGGPYNRPQRYTVCLCGLYDEPSPEAFFRDRFRDRRSVLRAARGVPTLRRAGEVARFLRDAAVKDGWPSGSRVEISGVNTSVSWTLRGRCWFRDEDEVCSPAKSSSQACKDRRKQRQ